MSTEVDPLSLAVIRARLEQIADEMDTVFERMSFSTVISDAWDRADGIYSATDGSMIVQGDRGLPIFVGTMQFTVSHVIGRIREPRPGDIYIVNDPYAGGTHIMDTRMVRPFFYRGSLFAYLANVGHWPDLGGRVPGGFGAAATDSYQEGLRLPAVRLFEEDRINTDILSIIQTNSRISNDIIGDVEAQASALRRGEARLAELLDEYGVELVNRVIATLRVRSAEEMRSCLREIPDGSYRYTEVMDNDGISDVPLRIDVKLTVAGDRICIDFSESSPPCEGPLNSVYATTASAVINALKHVFPDVAINSGIFEPIDLVVPTTTFLNATLPRPVAGCAAETSQRIIIAVLGALAKAIPDRVPAGSFGTVNNLALGGFDTNDEPYVMYSFLGGGYGGHRSGDGLSNGCSLMSIGRTQSIETFEQRYPVRFHRYALRDGSAGHGRFRGGFGVDFEYEFIGREATASLLGDQSKTPAAGHHGGTDGKPSAPSFTIDNRQFTLPLVSKGEGVKLHGGDRVRLRTPGGGGYGPAMERAHEDVQRDIDDGYIDVATAQAVYGWANGMNSPTFE